jgi:hypothetical protein
MGLNRAFDRGFFLIEGSVKKSGGSINLSKGQLALVDQSKVTIDGAKVVTSAAGKQKDKKDFVLRCGVADRDPNRSYTNKDQSTMPFSLNEIVALKVDAPKNTEHKVDEVIIGYNGFDANSAFNFKTGDSYFRLSLELKGGAIAFRGGKGDTEVVNINVEVPSCNPFENCVDCDECLPVDCKEVTLEAIERIKEKQLTGGATVSDFIDVTPVFSCDTPATLTEVAYDYYCLSVCDTGTDSALAIIESQYDTKVIRTDRVGSTSSYQMLLPATAGSPADYNSTLASYIKGCEDCPAGWTATDEGVLYAITLEDNGVDESAAIVADLGTAGGTVVTDSIVKSGNSYGVGYYTIILETALTEAQEAAYIGVDALTGTATIESLGDITALCENSTVTSTGWTQCGSCNVVEEQYSIIVPDDSCGNSRVDEIDGNYATTVTVAQAAASSVDLTITGTSGTATVSIDGYDYLMTFDTDLTTTAANFVTAHAVDIAANNEIVVTSAVDVLTFVGADSQWVLPTIVNTTTDLDGTFGSVTADTVDDRNACQTRYITSVVSNIVCDECDDIFKDYYVTEAPADFDIYSWTKVEVPAAMPVGNCLCGIKFKAKVFVIDMEESLRDLVGFTETSTQIRVAAGYPEEIREGIGALPVEGYPTTYLSRWTPRTHLAGNLRDLENEGRAYFQGIGVRKDYLGRAIRGEVTNMEDQAKQYIQYTLTVDHFNRTQSLAGRINEVINYDIFVEVGRQADVEALLNNLAAEAGVPTVQAFGA